MALTSHKLPSSDDFARLEGELFARLERGHTRQVRRHRLVAAAAIVMVAAGGTVAAGTVANPAAQTNLTFCYPGSDTSSRPTEALPLDAQNAGGKQLPLDATRINDALASCTTVWQSGVLGTTVQHPTLQACIQDNLTVAVFRKSDDSESAADFCDNLGLSAP